MLDLILLLSYFIQAHAEYLVAYGKEFKYLTCYYLLKDQPMMAGSDFGKAKDTRPMQLVSAAASSALLLQNLKRSTPANNGSPASSIPIHPRKVAEGRGATPQKLVSPVVPAQRESETINSEFTDHESESEAFLDSFTDYDGSGFLNSHLEEAGDDDLFSAGGSTITPVGTDVQTDATPGTADTTSGTQQILIPPLVSDFAREPEPHNSEKDLGAPNNLMGAKRAKRMRALERETQSIKDSIEKMQNFQTTTMNQAITAAKAETQDQLQAFSLRTQDQLQAFTLRWTDILSNVAIATGAQNVRRANFHEEERMLADARNLRAENFHQEDQMLVSSSRTNVPLIDPLLEEDIFNGEFLQLLRRFTICVHVLSLFKD